MGKSGQSNLEKDVREKQSISTGPKVSLQVSKREEGPKKKIVIEIEGRARSGEAGRTTVSPG